MQSPLTVYTSLTREGSPLRDDQISEGARFLAFTNPKRETKLWEQKDAYDRFTSGRRNSRIQKILAHQFIDSEYSLWLDANLALKVPAQRLVDEWLKDYDIAVWKHPERDCIYDEAMICAKGQLDDPEVIIEQVKSYEDRGYPKHNGLGEANMVLRRHTKKVERFNNAWWSEYCRHSVRDQLAFMYAADQEGIRVNFIDPAARKGNPYVDWARKGDTATVIAKQRESYV